VDYNDYFLLSVIYPKNIVIVIKFMEIDATIDRFEGDNAILITNDKKTITCPINLLPNNIKEGSVVVLTISEKKQATKNKTEQAKAILNEILDINKN